MLEINTNPGIAPDAGFAAAALQAGMSYDELIARILAAACAALMAAVRLAREYRVPRQARQSSTRSIRRSFRCATSCAAWRAASATTNAAIMASISMRANAKRLVGTWSRNSRHAWPLPPSEWFTERPVRDAEFPSGAYVRTTVRNGKCVFISQSRARLHHPRLLHREKHRLSHAEADGQRPVSADVRAWRSRSQLRGSGWQPDLLRRGRDAL